MPAAIEFSSPSPRWLSTLTGMIVAPYASPVNALPLFVDSAIVLATCVPWPYSSSGVAVASHARDVAATRTRAEVITMREADRRQIGRALVVDARVHHRDLDAAAAGPPGRDQVVPRARRVDAGAGQEVPLILLPAARRAAGPGIVRNPRLGGRDEHHEQQDQARKSRTGASNTTAARSVRRSRALLALRVHITSISGH